MWPRRSTGAHHHADGHLREAHVLAAHDDASKAFVRTNRAARDVAPLHPTDCLRKRECAALRDDRFQWGGKPLRLENREVNVVDVIVRRLDFPPSGAVRCLPRGDVCQRGALVHFLKEVAPLEHSELVLDDFEKIGLHLVGGDVNSLARRHQIAHVFQRPLRREPGDGRGKGGEGGGEGSMQRKV